MIMAPPDSMISDEIEWSTVLVFIQSWRETYFLDSEEDIRDEKNLAVVISYDHADKFREAGTDDPAECYRGKTIHVTGK